MVAAVWVDRTRAERREQIEKHELTQPLLVRHYPTPAEYEAHARELYAQGFVVTNVVSQRTWNGGYLVLAGASHCSSWCSSFRSPS
jgi:hypothetical protein